MIALIMTVKTGHINSLQCKQSSNKLCSSLVVRSWPLTSPHVSNTDLNGYFLFIVLFYSIFICVGLMLVHVCLLLCVLLTHFCYYLLKLYLFALYDKYDFI